LQQGRKIKPNIQLNVEPLKNSIRFGSYNLIEAEITNPNNYYYPVVAYLTRVIDMTIFDDIRKELLYRVENSSMVFAHRSCTNNSYFYHSVLIVSTIVSSSCFFSFG